MLTSDAFRSPRSDRADVGAEQPGEIPRIHLLAGPVI